MSRAGPQAQARPGCVLSFEVCALLGCPSISKSFSCCELTPFHFAESPSFGSPSLELWVEVSCGPGLWTVQTVATDGERLDSGPQVLSEGFPKNLSRPQSCLAGSGRVLASILLRWMLSKWVPWLLGPWPPGDLVQAKCILGDGTILDMWGSWGPAPSLGWLLPPAVAPRPTHSRTLDCARSEGGNGFSVAVC